MDHVIIIGGQRSGSTYLLKLLDEHPQIAMAQPVKPEPKVFLDDGILERGLEWYRETYFGHATDDTRVLGEKSTTYYERPDAGERIKTLIPDAKLLIALRDPVARAISNHQFSIDNGIESLPLAAALEAESGRPYDEASVSTSPFAYRGRGYYADLLAPFLDRFDGDQLRVLIFEEMLGSQAEVSSLYRWLGVDDDVVPPSLAVRVNASSAASAPVDPAVRRDLIDGYRESLDQLEEILGRPIPSWRESWATA